MQVGVYLMRKQDVIFGIYRLNGYQNTIFNYCISKCKKDKDNTYKVTIPYKKLEELIDNNDCSYVEIMGIANEKFREENRIYKICAELDEISAETMSINALSEYGEPVNYNYKLFNGYVIDIKRKVIDIYISDKVFICQKILLEYSSIYWIILSKFKNFETQILYELLRLWSEDNEVINKEFSINYLRYICGRLRNPSDKFITGGYIDDIFIENVIDAAVNEINKSKYMNVKYRVNKINSLNTSIEFSIQDNIEKQHSELKKVSK